MIFQFERTKGNGDWYETTESTPATSCVYVFFLRDFRAWFLQWVFK